jgi:hypothetical protein
MEPDRQPHEAEALRWLRGRLLWERSLDDLRRSSPTAEHELDQAA